MRTKFDYPCPLVLCLVVFVLCEVREAIITRPRPYFQHSRVFKTFKTLGIQSWFTNWLLFHNIHTWIRGNICPQNTFTDDVFVENMGLKLSILNQNENEIKYLLFELQMIVVIQSYITSFERYKWPQTKMSAISDTIFLLKVSFSQGVISFD